MRLRWKKVDLENWKCKSCGSKNYSHYHDYCSNCYRRNMYQENPVYKEKMKEKGRIKSKEYWKKKVKEDPKWNAKKQKEFRKKHPATFNYCMCRFYYRRLSLEDRERLRKQVIEEERCVMCGDTGIFQIGSGQTATLNGKDCTALIEAYYKKGQWLCEDCLFK